MAKIVVRFKVDFKVKIVLLLHWFPPKARESSLSCYLTHRIGKKRWIHAKDICTKLNTTAWAEFELGFPISLSVPTTPPVLQNDNRSFLMP